MRLQLNLRPTRPLPRETSRAYLVASTLLVGLPWAAVAVLVVLLWRADAVETGLSDELATLERPVAAARLELRRLQNDLKERGLAPELLGARAAALGSLHRAPVAAAAATLGLLERDLGPCRASWLALQRLPGSSGGFRIQLKGETLSGLPAVAGLVGRLQLPLGDQVRLESAGRSERTTAWSFSLVASAADVGSLVKSGLTTAPEREEAR